MYDRQTHITLAQVGARIERARFRVFDSIDHAIRATSASEYDACLKAAEKAVNDRNAWTKVYDAISRGR